MCRMTPRTEIPISGLVIIFLVFIIGLLLCLLCVPEKTCTRDHRVEPSHMAVPTEDGLPEADTRDQGAKA